MKKIIILLVMNITKIFSLEVMDFNNIYISDSERNLILFDEATPLYQRFYRREIDKDNKIQKIELNKDTGKAVITFNNSKYYSSYKTYTENNNLIYLFRILNTGSFIQIEIDTSNNEFRYKIERTGSLSKEPLWGLYKIDEELLLLHNLNYEQILLLMDNGDFFIWYKGYYQNN